MLSRHTRGREKLLCLLSVLSFFASCFFSALIVTFFAYLIILYLIFLFLSVLLHPSSLHSFLCHILLFKKKNWSLKEHFPSLLLFCSSYSITLSRAIMSQTSIPYLSLPFSKMQYFSCHHFLYSKAPPPIFFTFILLFSVTVSHRYFLTCHPLLLSCPASSPYSIYPSLSLPLRAAFSQSFESVWAARPKWFSITAAC